MHERAYSAPGFAMREVPCVTKLRVQVMRRCGVDISAVDRATLPATPNTACGADPFALWRAPDDWLVYSATIPTEELEKWVGSIASDAPVFVTDVSSASIMLELDGERATEILLRDCSLDLEGEAIPTGACAQTGFAGTTVMIHRPGNARIWRLFVERSVGVHVWEWLIDSAGSPVGAQH